MKNIVKSNKILLIFTAYAVFVFFFSLNRGVSTGNDGSHFALTKALVIKGTPEISGFEGWGQSDVSHKDGKVYSNKVPGFGYFCAAYIRVFGFMSIAVPEVYIAEYARSYFQNPREIDQKLQTQLVLLMPLLATGLFIVMHLLLLELGFSYNLSVFVSASFFPTTLFLRYYSNPYVHGFTTLLVAVSTLLLVRAVRTSESKAYFFSGLFWAYSVVCESMTLFLIVPFILYVVSIKGLRKFTIPSVAFFFGSTGPAIFFMYYNWKYFGSPFDLPVKYSEVFSYHKSFSTTFDFKGTVPHMRDLLFGTRKWEWLLPNYNGLIQHNVFMTSPLLKFALLGSIVMFFKKARRWVAVLCSFSFLISVAAIGSYVAFDGGADSDYRYMLFALPFLAPGLASFFDLLLSFIQGLPVTEISKKILLAVIFALGFNEYLERPFQTIFPDIYTLAFEKFEMSQLNFIQGILVGIILISVYFAFGVATKRLMVVFQDH